MNMWHKPYAIILLLIGAGLLIFRKRFADLIIRQQLENMATPKSIQSRQQLKEMKLEGSLHKFLEIAAIVFGTLVLLISVSRFFPQTKKYIIYILTYSMLSFLAGCVAALIELKFLFRFLWRRVRQYTIDRYGDSCPGLHSSSASDKLNAIRAVPRDDPILRALERKAIIYSIVCFIPLFVIFLAAFYTIFRLTR
jgi:hypothetical protein